MLILTNCMMDVADEGCIKVANSLVKRLKRTNSDVTVISYERISQLTDIKLDLNKFMLNWHLMRILRKSDNAVLYIPFPARSIATAIRVFILSRYCRRGIRVLLSMNGKMSNIAKFLLRISGAHIMVLSKEMYDTYCDVVGKGRVTYLKTGVDTQVFCPVDHDKQRSLKVKYGFDPNRPVVLHVGHLSQGRNIAQLKKIDPFYQVLLVTSTLTKDNRDMQLREELLHHGIRIMEDYIPDIQEIYQLSDVYFFPVQEQGHCIDVPLSCLEAAACNKCVITTRYGEMKAFERMEGFFFLDNFSSKEIHAALERTIANHRCNPRQAVLDYDWENALSHLSKGRLKDRRTIK